MKYTFLTLATVLFVGTLIVGSGAFAQVRRELPPQAGDGMFHRYLNPGNGGFVTGPATNMQTLDSATQLSSPAKY